MSAVFLRARTRELVVWVPEGRYPSLLDQEDFPGWDVWFTKECPPVIADWAQHCTFVAHNAEGFDAPAWQRFGVGDPEWCDTMHMCRAGAFPAGLDRACKALGLPGKDDTGHAAMKLLCKAKVVRGQVVYPVGTVPLWLNILRYNVQDVFIMEQLYDQVKGFGVPEEIEFHSRVNARGIPLDRAFAERLKHLWTAHKINAELRASELTDDEITGDNIRSVPKVKAWLARHGLVITSLERKGIEEMMRDPEGFFGDSEEPNVVKVREVILLRQQACRATAGKVDRALCILDPDGRARGCHVYHGAHTGRFSSRDLQIHNFARGVSKLDVQGLIAKGPTLQDVRDAAGAGVDLGDALSTLARPMIAAPAGMTFGICDFAGVEGRGVAWMGRCQKMLDVFADPKQDIYLTQAATLFGSRFDKSDKDQRFVGKVCILGCGYGMAGPKFGTTAKLLGCDLAKAGVKPEECVKAYRETFPEVPKLWRALQDAFEAALDGGKAVAGRCVFERVGNSVKCTLPSARPIYYRNAGREWRPADAMKPYDRWELRYDSVHGYRKSVYGGLLCENVVQAMCRDLLVDCAMRIDAEFPVVMHVHDEAVIEVPEADGPTAMRRMAEVMSTPPAWAKTFPLRVEGFTSPRYVKAPFNGATKVDYMGGREVVK